MKGRQKGRPVKWVSASIREWIDIGKPGITIEVWDKWAKKRKKFGELTVSVGGLRWWPHKKVHGRQVSWDTLAAWFAQN